MKKISSGAEAQIYLDSDENKIIKKRVVKNYRLPELDNKLRKTRTRREAKILEKMPSEVLSPKLIKSDDKKMIIEMDYIKGDKIRDILEKNIDICVEIGEKVAIMHNSGIIHGDLTTSNMIYSDKRVFFIDFGLSFFSDKVEDKAVDLHLLRQALESKHHTVFEKAFELVLKGYETKAEDYKNIMSRFKVVEGRGRNKRK